MVAVGAAPNVPPRVDTLVQVFHRFVPTTLGMLLRVGYETRTPPPAAPRLAHAPAQTVSVHPRSIPKVGTNFRTGGLG